MKIRIKNNSKMLSELNPHIRDGTISMNVSTHTYYVNGKQYKDSVSTFLKSFFDPFNMCLAIKFILRSKKMKDPSYEYYGMTATKIKDHWKNNADLGTELHAFIEDYYNGKERINTTVEYGYFKNFIRDHPEFVAYRTEFMIYNKKIELSGSIDMVCIKPNGHYTILDWKRAKRIDKESFNNKCSSFPGLEHIPDCNFYHYSFQLNIYKYILESEYNMIIDDLFLVIFHPNNNNYVIHEVAIMEEEIRIMIDERIRRMGNDLNGNVSKLNV